MTDLDLSAPLPLLPTPDSGCTCCTPTAAASIPAVHHTGSDGDNVATFAVTGMTCSHCVSAVTKEISALPGVTDVTVDLAPGATATVRVTSNAGVTRERVAAALAQAGDYTLTTG